MQLGIDARPLEGQGAGIGEYVGGLLTGLSKIDHNNTYFLFSSQFLEIKLPANFQNLVVKKSPFWHYQVAGVVRKKDLYFHATHSLIDAGLIGKKCILTVHDITALDFARTHSLKVRFLAQFLFSKGVKNAGAVITPTFAVKEEIIRRLKINPGKIFPIFEAVADDFGKNADEELLAKYNLKPGYIFFNATLEPRKNVPFLLQAYSKLENPPPLVLAGKKGWGYTPIKETIKKLNIDDQVRILDWVPGNDLESLYHYAAVFVYPSLAEGFGLSPLKALKAGVPAIVSDLPVTREVLGDAVLYTDLSSVPSLTAKITSLLSDRNLSEGLIQRGLKRVQEFSWGKTARETLRVYESVANENN